MGKTAVITARLDAQTLEMVDILAKAQGRSRSWFAAQAIQRVAESETDLRAFIQEGIDAIERGDVVPHEEVMRELDEMITEHRGKCGK